MLRDQHKVLSLVASRLEYAMLGGLPRLWSYDLSYYSYIVQCVPAAQIDEYLVR